jgi:hypothetical protein
MANLPARQFGNEIPSIFHEPMANSASAYATRSREMLQSIEQAVREKVEEMSALTHSL